MEIIKNMDEIKEYMYKKESFLHQTFYNFTKGLNRKWNIDIKITAHYDSLLITGKRKEIEPSWDDILNEINIFSEELGEKYIVTPIGPSEVSSDPHFKQDVYWQILLNRILKENEPEIKLIHHN